MVASMSFTVINGIFLLLSIAMIVMTGIATGVSGDYGKASFGLMFGYLVVFGLFTVAGWKGWFNIGSSSYERSWALVILSVITLIIAILQIAFITLGADVNLSGVVLAFNIVILMFLGFLSYTAFKGGSLGIPASSNSIVSQTVSNTLSSALGSMF
jgi:hypothetical protein